MNRNATSLVTLPRFVLHGHTEFFMIYEVLKVKLRYLPQLRKLWDVKTVCMNMASVSAEQDGKHNIKSFKGCGSDVEGQAL